MKILIPILLAFTIDSQEVKIALKRASEKYKVSYSTLAKIAYIESKYDAQARNKNSSAKGLFQIIRSTELWLRRRCDIQGDVMDPEVNSEMGACYLKLNRNYLIKHLKRNPTPSELYTLHFFGTSAGRRFIMTKDSVIAAKKFWRQARSNRNIFYKRNGKARTIREVKQLFRDLVQNAIVI